MQQQQGGRTHREEAGMGGAPPARAKGHAPAAAAAAAAAPPSILPLPRVADLDSVRRAAQEKQRVKEAEAHALVKNDNGTGGAPQATTNNGPGRTALYHPSWYETSVAPPDTSAPDSELALEYVHGYAGGTPGGGARYHGGGNRGSDRSGGGGGGTRSTNVVWLRSGEIVFPAAAVVVIHDFEVNRQRFFTGHDEASGLEKNQTPFLNWRFVGRSVRH